MREILEHYALVPEDARLQSGWGPLEFERTRELIRRHLPPPPQVVLDVGGGAGPYSEWLGSLGYEAHLVDLAPGHIEAAARRPHIASASLGDARQLPWDADTVDAVLLLGPLYHLTAHSDRALALAEARRVLRPGGLLFAAAICRFASLLAAMLEGLFDEPRFEPIVRQDLKSGQHRNLTGDPRFFTTAFFHRPEELQAEILSARFSLLDFSPVEGVAWLAKDFERCWANPAQREKLLEWVRHTEHEPALLAASPHLLAVAQKNQRLTRVAQPPGEPLQ